MHSLQRTLHAACQLRCELCTCSMVWAWRCSGQAGGIRMHPFWLQLCEHKKRRPDTWLFPKIRRPELYLMFFEVWFAKQAESMQSPPALEDVFQFCCHIAFEMFASGVTSISIESPTDRATLRGLMDQEQNLTVKVPGWQRCVCVCTCDLIARWTQACARCSATRS